jgi:hypothetical protein
MWLFLDDIRMPPSDEWHVVRSAVVAIELLKTGKVERISFDHDLGSDISGYHVANFIEQMAVEGKIAPLDWSVHSANPVGRANIERAMESAERFWARK